MNTPTPLTPEVAESLSNALAVWNMFLDSNKARMDKVQYETDKRRWLEASQWLNDNDPTEAARP